MLQVLDAGATTVNGYSGLWPPSYDELEVPAREYPSEVADALLADAGVRYVVADAGWLADQPEAEEWLDDRHERVFSGPDHSVFALRPGPG
jgi:hypothetical protein